MEEDKSVMSSTQRALSLISKTWNRKGSSNIPASECLPQSSPTSQRRSQSLGETPFDITHIREELGLDEISLGSDTVLYLAYGSNLSAETFKGVRGIKPLSQVNVLVPELQLTFDLPGIPYSEPCFANTRYRVPLDSKPAQKNDYHKDRWHKGLVGVVYEVTKKDYATIIATEGGGSGYQDVVVDCYEIPSSSKIVDQHPTTAPFKAHTLFAPALPAPKPGMPRPPRGGRIARPDPSYAQPSARYLKLITDGAEEHSLPVEYRDFLYQIRPYTLTSTRQRLGQFVFLSLWMPIIGALFAVSRMLADKNGRLPKWMIAISEAIFAGVWISYDAFFKRLFGDGERTQRDEDEEVATVATRVADEKRPLLSAR